MIILDLSRLVSRAGRATPTGIDRVELAYAEHLIASERSACFTILTPLGRSGPVPRPAAEAYIQALAQVWRHPAASGQNRRISGLARGLHAAALLRDERWLQDHRFGSSGQPAYLLVSHHHLERHRVIAHLKRKTQACFVCLIHDLIPIEYPEYALPGQDQKHRRRIETAAALADAVIVNSVMTRQTFQPYLERAGRSPPIVVAPLGVDLPALPPAGPPPLAPPYFVCVGTIEARKNHLLLLNVWRQLADQLGDKVPSLVLVGQRGWETENAIDMLERCPALRGIVLECSNLADAEVTRLIKGAQALLLPSFAEGFGFPLVEALALGVPVLCSDLAPLREVGGEVPEYFDPLDGIGWRTAVIDYSLPASPRRAAQLRRLVGWAPPSWQDHFAAVDALITEVRAPAPIRLAPRPEPQIDGREPADVR